MMWRRFGSLTSAGWQGLALVTLGAVALAAVALAPIAYAVSVGTSLDEARAFLSLLESKAQAAGRNPKPALLDAQGADSLFVTGRTPGLAAAELQRLAGASAAEFGITIERMQALETQRQGGMMLLRMQLDATGTIASLRDYLHAIETGTPLVFIREAHIGAGQGDNAESLQLRLEFEAFGWEGT